MPAIALRQKPETERAEFFAKSLQISDNASPPVPGSSAPHKLPVDWAQPDGQGAVTASQLLMLVQ